MITDKQKIQIEKEFISLLIKNKDLVGDWLSSSLSVSVFSETHHHILNAIEDAYSKDVLLTKKGFQQYIDDYIPKKLERHAQEHLYNSINALYVKRDDFPNLISEIRESYINEVTIKSIEDYKNNLQNNGTYATEKLYNNLQNIMTDTHDNDKKIIYEAISDYHPTFYENILKKREKGPDLDTNKCFIKEIDDTMVVGFAPGTLTLFCGDVGGFKSTMMLNVGANMWEKGGKNVLYVPLEMPRDKMYQKFLSRQMKISFDKLEHPHLLTQDEVKSIEKFGDYLHTVESEKDNKFYIMEAPEQIPVSIIRREIEKKISYFKPDVVVIDYIANLVTDKNTSRKDRNDLEIGAMLKSLRTMGKPGSLHDKGFAIVSGAQIGREALKRIRRTGLGKGSFYSEDIRGSHEYSADADNMYAQMEDPQQPGEKLFLFCVKARYGKKQFSHGSGKATLNIQADIGLITTGSEIVFSHNQDQVLKKIHEIDDLNFDESEDEDDSSNDGSVDDFFNN